MGSKTLALVALWLLGCSDERFVFHFSEGTDPTPDEQTAIQMAFNEWCTRSGRHYCALLEGGGDSEIQFVESLPPPRVADISISYNAFTTEHYRIRVSVERKRPDWLDVLRREVRHELGHAFRGYFDEPWHLPPGNVMTPCIPDQPDELTEADMWGPFVQVEGCGR